MDITRSGAQASARVIAVSVTFEPGSRTHWHTHPLGQTLIVTEACGLVQSWGGSVRRIFPGDVVWCPPGEKHWHGATATTGMTHIAMLEHLDGKNVEWMERVTDEEYGGGCPRRAGERRTRCRSARWGRAVSRCRPWDSAAWG